jgi:hypothetical protein
LFFELSLSKSIVFKVTTLEFLAEILIKCPRREIPTDGMAMRLVLDDCTDKQGMEHQRLM